MRLSFDLLGPQGSGKGTQAKILLEHFEFVHLDVGDVLRRLRHSGSQLGEEVASYMDHGEPVPTDLIIEVTEKSLRELPQDRDVLLDGAFRGLAELEKQRPLFERFDLELPVIIFLNVDDQTAIDRISKRRVCPQCGHRQIVQEGESETCARCGHRLERRHDDTPEAIRHRLDWYHRETEAVVNYFRENGTVIDIDATPSIETVGQRVVAEVTRYYESRGLTPPVRWG